MRRGDKIGLTAVVEDVRSDGTVILRIAASTSLIPAIVVSTLDLLRAAEAPLAATLQPFGIGARVASEKGERGQVVPGDNAIPRVKRLHGRDV